MTGFSGRSESATDGWRGTRGRHGGVARGGAYEPPPDLHADSHPSRFYQERVLRDPKDLDAWRGLRHSYAEMSPDWREWTSEQRDYELSVREGLRAVRPVPWAVEICCGTGEATVAVGEVVPRVFACDLNLDMVRRREDVPEADWFAADVQVTSVADGRVPLVGVTQRGVQPHRAGAGRRGPAARCCGAPPSGRGPRSTSRRS